MAEKKIIIIQVSFSTLNSSNPHRCKTWNSNIFDCFSNIFSAMKHTNLERNRKRSWIEQQKGERVEDCVHQVPAVSATLLLLLLLLPDCLIRRRHCDLPLVYNGDKDSMPGLSCLDEFSVQTCLYTATGRNRTIQNGPRFCGPALQFGWFRVRAVQKGIHRMLIWDDTYKK